MLQSLIFHSFFIGFTSLSALIDAKENKIPNKLILFGFAGGVLFNAFKGAPQLYDSVLGFLAGIGVLLIPFALGWMGAGDVKLLGALGAILGFQWLPRVFFYCALFGGLLAAASIVLRKGTNLSFLGRSWQDLSLAIASRGAILPQSIGTKKVATVPYGVAIGLGAMAAFYLDPNGDWAGF